MVGKSQNGSILYSWAEAWEDEGLAWGHLARVEMRHGEGGYFLRRGR